MPTSKSAEKRVRQNEKRSQYNKRYRTTVKEARRELEEAVEEDAGEEKIDELRREAIGCVDKAANKGVIHRNKAARLKSQIDSLASQ